MRQSIRIYLLSSVSVIVLSAFFLLINDGNDTIRYHQHLQQPSEADLDNCSLCDGESQLCTHLPIISIETNGQKIPGKPIISTEKETLGQTIGYEKGNNGETEIQVRLETVETEGVWHHEHDNPTLSSKALFNIRGKSSRSFDKSSYKIQLISEKDLNKKKKLPLLGMAKGSEWSLHGPFLDKTLMRNYMWMNLSAEVIGYSPNVRYCELILNGQYQGVYVLMETIREGSQRLNLTNFENEDEVYSYLLRINPHINPLKVIDNFTFYSKRLEVDSQVELLYPTTSKQTEKVKRFVTADFNEIEKHLYSWEMNDNPESCWNYLDMDSFVNYYILQEFLAINDMFSASTYFYKDVRRKLHIGPVWDFNNALDNYQRPMPVNDLILDQRGWYSQLMKSQQFVERVIARYHKLRNGVLSEKNLELYANEVELWLGSAVERNFQIWGYTFDITQIQYDHIKQPYECVGNLTPEYLNPTSYQQAMEFMLDYMRNRGSWLDEHIDTLRQYCHPSKRNIQTLD